MSSPARRRHGERARRGRVGSRPSASPPISVSAARWDAGWSWRRPTTTRSSRCAGSAARRANGSPSRNTPTHARMVTTTVAVESGRFPRLPVRTVEPVPKALMGRVCEELRSITVEAPVTMGDVVCRDIAGSGVDVIASRYMLRPDMDANTTAEVGCAPYPAGAASGTPASSWWHPPRPAPPSAVASTTISTRATSPRAKPILSAWPVRALAFSATTATDSACSRPCCTIESASCTWPSCVSADWIFSRLLMRDSSGRLAQRP